MRKYFTLFVSTFEDDAKAEIKTLPIFYILDEKKHYANVKEIQPKWGSKQFDEQCLQW